MSLFTPGPAFTLPSIIRDNLPTGWDFSFQDNGRVLYLNHEGRKTQRFPPKASWQCIFALPFGWELAQDNAGRRYFINHIEQYTSYDDPRDIAGVSSPSPKPREVVLYRDPKLGFGFVAGSELPVVVRYVTEGGPSDNKLYPGDEIWTVDSQDASCMSKADVVAAIRNAGDVVRMIVCQPAFSRAEKKSSLLTMSKKVRQRTQPSHVRFAEGVTVSSNTPSSSISSWLPQIPNVLRVFLENDQTKIFRYDADTTVEDVLLSLKEKINLVSIAAFGLFVEQPQTARSSRLQLLSHSELISVVATRPGSQQFRCVLRVAFYPFDPVKEYINDPVAFDYLYHQCINDLRRGRFLDELRFEPCLRIAALHIQQVLLDKHGSENKMTLKKIERQYGLETFLPSCLLDSVRKKEVRKHIRYYLKRDQKEDQSKRSSLVLEGNGLRVHGTFSSDARLPPSEQIKAKYIHILSHQHTFGGKQFHVSIKNTPTEMNMTVACNPGVLLQNIQASATPVPIFVIYYNTIKTISVTTDNDGSKVLIFTLEGEQTQVLEFVVDKDEVEEAVNYVHGYYMLSTGLPLDVMWLDELKVPPFEYLHQVFPSMWNYACNHKLPEDVCAPLDLRIPLPAYSEIVKEIQIMQDNYMVGHAKTVLDTNFNRMRMAVHHIREDRASPRIQDDDHSDLDRNRQGQMQQYTVPLSVLPSNGAQQAASVSPSRILSRLYKKSTSDSCCSDSANLSSMSGSESETLSTPSDSPMHRSFGRSLRALRLNSMRSPSFGLHSPDALPCGKLSDDQLEKIVSALGIQGSPLEELLLLFPDNFVADRDIIDLTREKRPGTAEPTGEIIRPPTPFQDDEAFLTPIKEQESNDSSTYTKSRAVSFDERVLVSPIPNHSKAQGNYDVTPTMMGDVSPLICPSETTKFPLNDTGSKFAVLSSFELAPERSNLMVNGHNSLQSSMSISMNDSQEDPVFFDSQNGDAFCPTATTFDSIRKCTIGHLRELDALLDRLPARSPRRSGSMTTESARAVLLAARCFASSSKLLLRAVSDTCAACDAIAHLLRQTREDLDAFVSACFTLLHCYETLYKAQLLGAKTREVLLNFELILKLADSAQGQDIRDPRSCKLLRQSTTFAASLTSFIQAVDCS